MVTVGVILWVLFLAWLVSALYPSQEMRRDTFGNYVYYSLWVFLFVSVLLIQYRIMAPAGHSVPAVTGDVIGVSLGAVRLWSIWRYRHHLHSSDDDGPSSQGSARP